MWHLRIAWVVSFIATMGSLYFSEIKKFIPCELCWYQRILMYPLAIILMISLIKEDTKVRHYVLPISIIGMCVSSYHYAKQKLPFFAEIGGTCEGGVSCSGFYVNYLGFITIPFMALTAFTIITITLLLLNKKEKRA